MRRLPQPSFVSMIDAVLCAVCVLVILVVVAPRSEQRAGQLPRAQFHVACEIGDDILRFLIVVRSADAAEPVATVSADDDGHPGAAVVELREQFEMLLRPVEALSVRVAVAVSGRRDGPCLDTVRCALALEERGCLTIAAMASWEPPRGIARPVLSFLYGEAKDPP